MKQILQTVFISLLLVTLVLGDCYLQNPHGSNDRNQEANTNRDNANHLFDSQNNAKGGYCRGPAMTFYEHSLLTVEWTIQHGCGNPKVQCNLVLQYMCSDSDADNSTLIRDGTTTDTITDDAAGPAQMDGTEYHYALHETRTYYDACNTRQRNMGLYIADREDQGGLTPDRSTCIFTRQNNNGDRYGYECQEERDYYPYWAPSPWKDIAVLVDHTSYCSFYQSQSNNVMARYQCQTTAGVQATPNNEAECVAGGFQWVKIPANGGGTPDCVVNEFSRENHLGNTITGNTLSYNWTLPDSGTEPCISNNNCNCALRTRYNISAYDMGGSSANSPEANFIDWTSNGDASPVKNDGIVYVDGLPHELATDTTQYGRTFQDRSYMFHISNRPGGVPSLAKIYNLNYRGKRGNIVETYPATEYDFVPKSLSVFNQDYIHFQWTGCDENPAGNAGEGTDQTDRVNIVQTDGDKNLPATDDWVSSNTPMFESKSLRQYMAMLGQPVNNPNLCLNYTELLAQNGGNTNNADQDKRNCMKLNAAGPYFNGGLVQMNKTATFHYISTRNNNFTNRDQKGTLYVNNLLPNWAIALVSIGGASFVGAGVVGGLMFYGKSHPLSPVAQLFNKL